MRASFLEATGSLRDYEHAGPDEAPDRTERQRIRARKRRLKRNRRRAGIAAAEALARAPLPAAEAPAPAYAEAPCSCIYLDDAAGEPREAAEGPGVYADARALVQTARRRRAAESRYAPGEIRTFAVGITVAIGTEEESK